MSAQVAADLRGAANALTHRDFLDASIRSEAAREVIEPLISAELAPKDDEVIAALLAAADAAEAQS